MTQDVRTVRAEKRQNRAYRAAFVHQGLLKKDFSTGSLLINEVVLGTSVNKGKRKGRGCSKPRPFCLCVITLESLRSDYPSDHPGLAAKVAHPELEFSVWGLLYQPAPLGTAVESPSVRRRGHRASSTRGGDRGEAVEV